MDVAVVSLVLDVCAAPGGKATEIASRGATVIAADLRASRVRLIAQNAERLELSGVLPMQGDGTAPAFRPETFDAVLIDAPCSGLGALRRRADARWRITPDDIESLGKLQERLLEAAAPLVRRGGTLVYSVCTLTRRESVDVVAACAELLAELGFVGKKEVGEGWHSFGTDVEILPPSETHDGMCRSVFERR